jgi:hypothetical protein
MLAKTDQKKVFMNFQNKEQWLYLPMQKIRKEYIEDSKLRDKLA